MDDYELEEELDDTWIKQIEEEEKDYNSFYKEEIRVFQIRLLQKNI